MPLKQNSHGTLPLPKAPETKTRKFMDVFIAEMHKAEELKVYLLALSVWLTLLLFMAEVRDHWRPRGRPHKAFPAAIVASVVSRSGSNARFQSASTATPTRRRPPQPQRGCRGR